MDNVAAVRARLDALWRVRDVIRREVDQAEKDYQDAINARSEGR